MVYNLEVDGEHVYHVGTSGLLVHKSCGNAGGGNKRGPKTDPDAPHNRKIREVADQLEAEGNTIISGGGREKERLRDTKGGHKGGRRADIEYNTPDGQRRGVNVGRKKKNGDPIKREREAIDDLSGPGSLPTDFVPWN